MMHTMDTLALVLLPLAVARVTRFVTEDRIFQALRLRLLERWIAKKGEESLAAYFLVCPWCVSIWTGAAGAATWWAWGGSRLYAACLLALACSYVTGWLAAHGNGGE